MILRRRGAGFAGALLGALVAAHAGALESVSGSYEGKMS
jgi:hypothetical protein